MIMRDPRASQVLAHKTRPNVLENQAERSTFGELDTTDADLLPFWCLGPPSLSSDSSVIAESASKLSHFFDEWSKV